MEGSKPVFTTLYPRRKKIDVDKIIEKHKQAANQIRKYEERRILQTKVLCIVQTKTEMCKCMKINN